MIWERNTNGQIEGNKKVTCKRVVWSVHLSGQALCLISATCPIFLLNSFLTFLLGFMGEGLSVLHVCVYGSMSAATGVRPWAGKPMYPWCQ